MMDQGNEHLYRVFLAMAAAISLTVWQQQVLLEPLKKEGIEMAHMDPSEIAKIPYDFGRLGTFVMFPVTIILFLAFVKTPEKIFSYVASLGRFAMVAYALLGLCGAHIVTEYQHSLCAALYIGSLVSTTARMDVVTSQIMQQLPFHDHSDLLKTCRLYGILLGPIPFQILSVLDRGIQIQRWPIPVVLGVTFGYVLGTFAGLVLMSFQRRSERRRR